jgi:acid stress chaperone HdeB
MKIVASAVAASLVVLFTAPLAPCYADDIDLSVWTCKQYTSASQEIENLILVWLDGYYKTEDDPPTIDLGQFTANAKKLGDYCTAHPDSTLITATDKLFQKE